MFSQLVTEGTAPQIIFGKKGSLLLLDFPIMQTPSFNQFVCLQVLGCVALPREPFPTYRTRIRLFAGD